MVGVEVRTDFDVAFAVDEDVIAFDVSVYDLLRVQMLQAEACLCARLMIGHSFVVVGSYLATDCSNMAFVYLRIVVDKIDERTSVHVVHDDPEHPVVINQEGIQEVDDVFMLPLFHDDDFIHQRFLSMLSREVHLFDGDTNLGALSRHELLGDANGGLADGGHIDRTRCSLTNFLVLLV